MKCKALVSGNTGSAVYAAGDELNEDSEHVRRLLVNGLAKPLDAEAKKVAADDEQKERYRNGALAAVARELGD